MRVIAFANLKGGSAKTTSAIAIAAEAAVRGRSVLVIDLDPQATLTTSAGLTPGPAAAQLLSGTWTPKQAANAFVDVFAVQSARASEEAQEEGGAGLPATDLASTFEAGAALHVLPADRSLIKVERSSPMQLSQRIVSLLNLVEGEYDIVVIDTPPQASALVTSALASADDVVVPVATGRGALDGLNDVIELTERMGLPRVTGTFATRVNTSSIHDRELAAHVAEKIVREAGGPAIGSFVRETVRVREAEMARIPLALYARDSTASKDYGSVLDELDSLAAQ